MNTSMSQTLSSALDDLRSEASAAADEARDDARRVARELPYAFVGSVGVGVRRARRILGGIARSPSRALERLRRAPRDLRDAYWERADHGHEVVDRVRGRKGARRASRYSARSARSATKAASSHARRAARATSRAMSDAAEALDPADSRPYEERTVEELYELASERHIEGRSQMNKGQLVRALRERRA